MLRLRPILFVDRSVEKGNKIPQHCVLLFVSNNYQLIKRYPKSPDTIFFQFLLFIQNKFSIPPSLITILIDN